MDLSIEFRKMWLASGLEIESDSFQPWVCPACFTTSKYYQTNFDCCQEPSAKGIIYKPLPRQDQLMKLLSEEPWLLRNSTCYELRILSWGKNKVGNDISVYGTTVEQAILKGIMYEKHKLVWSWAKHQPRDSWIKKE